MAVASPLFANLLIEHQAIVLLLDAEVVAQENFHKLADHVAHQARFEYRPVFPILLEPCDWKKSSLQYIPVYPLNKQPVNQWTPPAAAWNQVADEIWQVLKPYTAFYPESPRAKALRSIGKVAVGTSQSFVSGFLIASDVLLTSNTRLIDSSEKAAQATVSFTDAGGLTATFTLAPDHFFLTDAETGISLVGVTQTPVQSDYQTARTLTDYYTLKLASEPVKSGDRLDAAHFDRAQQLWPNTQTVDFADDEHIQYRGSLIPGAPGGPLLNENLEVVAVNPSHRERSDYEMLDYNIQSRTVAESSATVQTIETLFRQINQGKTAKDWTDASGNIVLPEPFRNLINEPFTKETDKPTEVFTTIPYNRTLIALKLTNELNFSPTIEYALESMAAVFDHFKPTVDIEFLTENGTETEKLFFNTLDDFGPVGIERISGVVKRLKAQRQGLSEAARNWERIDPTTVERIVPTEQMGHLQDLLIKNLTIALGATRELEISYRSLALFYENAGTENLSNVSIINADKDQLLDLDNPIFFDAVAIELRGNYDRLDLSRSYSFLVIPGGLGNKHLLEKWAQIAHQTKVLLMTDYRHVNSILDLQNLLNEGVQSGNYRLGFDEFLGNALMTCNYLLGREAFKEVEEEALYLPPSCAMAGKLYSKEIQESVNQLTGLQELRFEITKQQGAAFGGAGLVCLSNSSGYATASSTRTLYNGENEDLRMYPTVRVIDWLPKVFMDFLNKQPLENWTYGLEMDMRQQIELFLTSIKGPDKIIYEYSGLRLEQDPMERGRVLFDVQLKLGSLNKFFRLSLECNRTDNGPEWNTRIDT